jgi:acyl-CoA synthetase (AMP-forming)/AMP-acid ligase II
VNFALFLEMKARGNPEGLALVDKRLRMSWRELDAAANRFANLLRRRDLKPKDRLAIYLPNRAELAIAFLGALKAGVIAVPLNWRYVGQDLARVLAHCAPGLTVTTSERSAAVGEAGAPLILDTGEEPQSSAFWDELSRCSPEFELVGCQNSDIANLLYTSGTTSLPKAAIHTHGMRVSIASAMADCFKLSSRDVGLAVSPMFHTSGMSVFSNCIFAGCTLVMLDRWDLTEFVAAIAAERVTFMHLIATIIVDIARAPAELFAHDKSAMRFTWGGGHSADPSVFETFERRVGGLLLQGYSRTEGGLAYNLLDPKLRRFDAHGYPNRNSSELAIIDPATETPVGKGEVGEICVRGDGVAPGYWDGPFVRMRRFYEGGWQPTGDLGYLDEMGALHFLGRDDHMIKTGGENVYPDEIAAALMTTPEVADVAVIGLADERLGQRVAALVVPSGAEISEGDVERASRSVLSGFKIPRTIVLVDALPRLGTQKVDLAACRDLLLRRAAADRA